MERNYIAFISYRHIPRDMAIAKQLHSLIENYVIPKGLRKSNAKKLGIVFRDQEELSASYDLSLDIQLALAHSEYLIVICSPGSSKSDWVQREIQYFLQTHDRSHVLTVLTDGEPGESFPAVLTQVYDEKTETFRETEPLAVDVRAKHLRGARYRLRKEYLRLVTAILGCSYDNLILREQRRLFLRMLSAAMAVCFVISCFLGILWNKNRQIEQKNEELAVEKANVQYRESQLLTADAETAMSAGDYRTAIQLAVDALTVDGSLDRPYYAPAESVLLEAMNIFREKETGSLLYDTVLEQMTPIVDFCISDNGTKIFTIDSYGQIHCFDTSDGRILWSSYTQASNYDLADSAKYFVSKSPNCVTCLFDECLTCFNQDTGARLWERDIGGVVKNSVYYDPRQDVFLCSIAEYDMLLDCSSIHFDVISGNTGELLWSIPFVQTKHLTDYVYSQKWRDLSSAAGTFSSDGNLFFGSYVASSEEDNVWTLQCYIVDMQNKAVQLLCEEILSDADYWDEPFICGVSLTDQENSLIITLEGVDSAAITKLELSENTLVWKTNISLTSDQIVPSDKKIYTEVWDSVFFVSCADALTCLDAETGEILDCTSLPGEVIQMDTTGKNTIGFFLDSGEYGIAWKNPAGIHISTTSVGLFRSARNYGGGVLQFYSDEQKGEYEISVSNRVSEGYAAIIPTESSSRIIIKRPLEKIQCVQEAAIALPFENTSAYRPSTVFSDADTIVIGPFEHNFEDTDYYVAIDRNTREILQVYEVRREYPEYSVFFAPDEDRYILHTPDGNVILHTGGMDVQLAAEENSMLGTDGYSYYIYDQICCDAAYLTDTRNVLTARLGRDQISIWYNGEETNHVPLPENQVLDPGSGKQYSRFVRVCPNGDILINNYADSTLSDLSVYNVDTQTWSSIPYGAALPNRNALAISDRQKRLAVADNQDILQVINYDTGTLYVSFPLQMPYSAVVDMLFLMDDSVLAVKTEDNQLWVYDISTGVVVFRTILDGSRGTKLRIFEDRQNQRLYISDHGGNGSPNGVCIDLRTWTQLAAIDNMLFYDDAEKIFYQCQSPNKIVYLNVPCLVELVEIGKVFLHTG